MDRLKEIFIDKSAQIWALILVAFGSFANYISNSAAEKRKNKRLVQKEKVVQILIPYCTCLEETIAMAKTIYSSDDFYKDFHSYDKWIYALKKPLEYLNAAKGVFLSEKSHATLQQYKVYLSDFEIIMEKECCNCLIKYKHYIEKAIIKFPNISSSMSVQFSMSDIATLKLKLAIIKKMPVSLVNDFTVIDFIHNDDPDNCRATTVYLNKEIWETWGAIDCGIIDINDVDDPNAKLACILLDYISETAFDEKDVLTNIIDKTTGATLSRELLETLENERNTLIKEIDNSSR